MGYSGFLLPTNVKSALTNEVICALDLGSKNFKFVSGHHVNGRIQTKLLNKISLNLGNELNQYDGVIRPNKLSELESVLGTFAKYCHNKGISKFLAIATSAVRNMKNNSEIVALARNAGIELEIADGQREGEIGYLAATYGEPNCIVAELGSHSCQIAWDDGNEIKVDPLNIGYQRIFEEFFRGPVDFGIASNIYRKYLDQHITHLPATAGGFSALAANSVAAIVLDKDKKDVRGTYLKRSDLQRKLNNIEQLSDTDFEGLKRSLDKASKILPGMVFLDYIMGRSGHDQVLISDAELPVGLIVEYFKSKKVPYKVSH
jgi:exopolyphosphatase/pppGpp-phosphohydrolase